MKVCAVIVTYGDRFHLLRQVMDACYKEGIDKIIVIDNASAENSKKQLKEYEKEHRDKIRVIYLDENTGSAGGYKRGLEEAYKCEECEYILTLDDDNVIPEKFLKKIKGILDYLDDVPKDKLMLSLYRPIMDCRVVEEGWVKGYKPNNFTGLNFLEVLKRKIIRKIINKKKNYSFFPLNPIEVAAMGGLFFHKTVINLIGYPKEELFLYADDHEYTYRFVKSGGNIFMAGSLVVRDIDQTYVNGKGEKIHLFSKDFSGMKLYYGVRNHTYLSKKFITFKPFFYGNLLFVLILQFRYIFKTPLSLFISRYKLYLKAVFDGLNDRLGERF
jgi:GT2 family glycosyltransferase